MNILDSFLEFLCKQEKLIRLRDNITVYRVQGRYIYFTLEELYDYFYKNIHIMKKPTKIKNIDFKELETICEKYIDEFSKGNKSY